MCFWIQSVYTEWLAPFVGDHYAAYCKSCRCKLHAHKKGLLAHAKSSKHRKHDSSSGVLFSAADAIAQSGKKIKKAQFNEQWLEDSLFASWLRKIPNNCSKALCVACRSVITAGRSELVKHSQAAKHKKALSDGVPVDLPDFDFAWLDPSYEAPSNSAGNGTTLSVSVVNYSSVNTTTTNNNNNHQLSDHDNDNNHTMPILETVGLPLSELVAHLKEKAPLHLAESWDNVGLLVEPSEATRVHNVLLTIDLTQRVMEEATRKRVNLIIAYHPPIFRPLKSLLPTNWKEKIMLQCVENRMAVYSPHTALDAVKGGLNDWLTSAYGPSNSRPIKHSYAYPDGANNFTNCLDVLVSESEEVTQALSCLENVMLTVKGNEYGGCDVRVCCDDATLPKVVEILLQHPVAQLCSRITKLEKSPLPGTGVGRICDLKEPLPLYEVIHRTKQHIDQPHVRLALGSDHTRDSKMQSIAVCAGSGGSVLRGVRADVLVTGEMSHHEVLDATHSGTSVILCEHTNTERGYLKNWCSELKNLLGPQNVNILVSDVDKDPLRVV